MSTTDKSHSPGTRPLGKRARQRIERPREILAAALDEFMRKGFWAARIEDVAARVGVTKGTVYFYFETKEKLFAEVVRHFSPVLHADQAPVDGTRTVRVQLEDYLGRLHAAIASQPETRRIFHLLISEGRHFPELLDQYFEEFLTPALDHLRALLEAGVRRGEFRQAAAPELLVGPSVIANIWVSVFSDRRPLDAGALLSSGLDLFFEGLVKRDR